MNLSGLPPAHEKKLFALSLFRRLLLRSVDRRTSGARSSGGSASRMAGGRCDRAGSGALKHVPSGGRWSPCRPCHGGGLWCRRPWTRDFGARSFECLARLELPLHQAVYACLPAGITLVRGRMGSRRGSGPVTCLGCDRPWRHNGPRKGPDRRSGVPTRPLMAAARPFRWFVALARTAVPGGMPPPSGRL